MKKFAIAIVSPLLLCGLMQSRLMGQAVFPAAEKEEDYYHTITIPVPENISAEVGGMTTLPDGRVAFCTRRGDVWLMENPTMEKNRQPYFRLYASGLHEPLGLAYKDNSLFVAQRGELTKLSDTDGDDVADLYKTVYAWPLSGHYHEYSYGPKIAPDGSMFVTGNVAFGDEEWWRGESRVPGRGWSMRITPEGKMELWATGFRSPAGLGMIDGEFFYADNQGDWFGSGGIWRVKRGAFMGHPAGLAWSGLEGSPVTISAEKFFSTFDERRIKKNGFHVKPENSIDEKNPVLLSEAKKAFPQLQLPSVLLPHGILGISNSEILKDTTGGKFGPFAGQIFIGDQGQSKIMRVVMEKVGGEYQGVAFDFVSDFQSGVMRMTWGNDGSLFVGETNRGWGSAGTSTSGLQRLVWSGKTPMEMKTVRSMPDGFEIEFTKPVNKATANDLSSYNGNSFTYKYHSVYGSPVINNQDLNIKGVRVSDDGKKVRLVIDNLRQYYLHHVDVRGVRAADGSAVLHPNFYYTLNAIAGGDKLAAGDFSTKRSVSPPVAKASRAKGGPRVSAVHSLAVPSKAEVDILLNKNTCSACHHASNKQVGPAFAEIAKRRYSNEKMVQLIYNPQPGNWPGYSTEMPPMPQVPKDEALKIAAWINSLRQGD